MGNYTLTDHEGLPAGTDITALLADPLSTYRDLFAVLTTYRFLEVCRTALTALDARASSPSDMERRDLVGFRTAIAEHADVTPAQALQANRKLVDQLVGTRWHLIQAAREAGDSWAAIGEAMGMTKQGAIDWYKRKIADQEKFLPEFHDAARARAVLAGAE